MQIKIDEDAKRILVAEKKELQARGISGADMSDAIRSLAARREQE